MTLLKNISKATDGELSARIHVDPPEGFAKGLYWDLTINCPTVSVGNEEWCCYVFFDGVQWPIQRWEELDGMTLKTVTNPDDIDPSLHLIEAHSLKIESFSLTRIQKTPRFIVQITGYASPFYGFEDLIDSNTPVSVKCEVDFKRITLIPDAWFSKPISLTEAKRAAEQFLILDRIASPYKDKTHYIFEPM